MTLTNQRWRWQAVAIAAVAAAGAAAGPATLPTTVPTAVPATAPAATAADTTVVRRGTLVLAFDADVVFEPVDPFAVRFEPRHYTGELTVRKAAAAGATVGKGDLLLALDTDPIDRQIAAAESAVAVARAAVTKAESDVTLGDKADADTLAYAKQAAADADAGLARWDQTDGPAAVLTGKLEGQQGDAQLDDASDELAQLREMYKSEDLTNQTADIVLKRAVRNLDVYKGYDRIAHAAADRAVTYEPAVHRHGLTAGVAAAAMSVQQLGASQGESKVTRSAALTTARATAADAERDLADLKHDRAGLTVTSPVDGVVVYGAFEHKAWQPVDPEHLAAEQKVQAGQTLVTVYQPGHLRATIACPEPKLLRLWPGLHVSVTPAPLPDASYDGTCGPAGVFAAGDKGQETVDVPVTLPAVDPRLAPGYIGTAAVDVPPAADVLLVPKSAVWHGKAWVHTPAGTDEPRSVVLGRTDGPQVEVRSGLKDGDVVLTTAKRS